MSRPKSSNLTLLFSKPRTEPLQLFDPLPLPPLISLQYIHFIFLHLHFEIAALVVWRAGYVSIFNFQHHSIFSSFQSIFFLLFLIRCLEMWWCWCISSLLGEIFLLYIPMRKRWNAIGLFQFFSLNLKVRDDCLYFIFLGNGLIGFCWRFLLNGLFSTCNLH